MAKYGIYSDLHISYTSSIMPLYYKDSKYTTRLQMIIDTAKWMYKVFSDNEVDMILNGGDVLDSNVVRSEEISALSEFYNQSRGIQEICIPGNHEILSNNLDFYSSSILGNLPFIKIFDKPTKINDELSVLPYMNPDNITDDILRSIKNKILLSHIDIMGSHLRPDYIMDSGVNPELLCNYFNMVINGHLHTAEEIDTTRGTIMNIGSVSSISFSDSNVYVPSICILDSETMSITRYENPFSILFRRINTDSISDLLSKLKSYPSKYRYIFRVTCPYDIREEVSSILHDRDNVITYRVVSNISKSHVSEDIVSRIDTVDDIEEEFRRYIDNNQDSLTYPTEKYIEVLDMLRKEV